MNDKMIIRRAMVLVIGVLITAGSGIASAVDFGNMMNPSRWMGGNQSDDYYGDRRGGPGYGYGAPGYGYAPGYGAPPYGMPAYGAPGYSAPGLAPGYTVPPAGNASSDTSAKEIEQLKQRIKELEKANSRMAPPAYGSGQPGYAPAAPGYREQGGYAPPSAYSGQSQYQSSSPSYGGQTTYQPVQPNYGNQAGTQATQPPPAFGGQPVYSPSPPSAVR